MVDGPTSPDRAVAEDEAIPSPVMNANSRLVGLARALQDVAGENENDRLAEHVKGIIDQYIEQDGNLDRGVVASQRETTAGLLRQAFSFRQGQH